MSTNDADHPQVLLVSMPYGAPERPAIGLSILSAALNRAGITCRVEYANLRFAERIGLDCYQALGNGFVEFFLGEWSFAGAAFPDFNPDYGPLFDYVERETERTRFKQRLQSDDLKATLLQIRAEAGAFVRTLAEEIVQRRPSIVGCGSTFNQHCPSLALLREIRRLDPNIVTVLGGANCEGSMGVANKNACDWLDFVVSGEADELIVPFCREVLKHGKQVDPALLPHGVIGGKHPALQANCAGQAPRAIVANMDNVAMPDFADYFAALEQVAIGKRIRPGLLYESSRGCWWGNVSHCTFCGLNGSGLGYRSKSPERVIDELALLSDKHGIACFEFVDNILDMDYFHNVVPALADKGYTIFFETKSNLARRHVEALAQAGVKWIQPGIESLHDGLLKLIGKGCTGAINLQLLKWASEYGVCIFWIFLVELPFEQDEWYAEMAELIPYITHLQPPLSITPLQYHRFSLYHADPEAYRLSLQPIHIYRYIYPLPEQALADMVYFFELKTGGPDKTRRPGYEQVVANLREWWQAYDDAEHRPKLEMTDNLETLAIADSRPCAAQAQHLLSGLARAVYLNCDSGQSFAGLMRTLDSQAIEADEASVNAIVDQLLQNKLMVKISGKLLSLAVNKTDASLAGLAEFPGGHIQPEPETAA